MAQESRREILGVESQGTPAGKTAVALYEVAGQLVTSAEELAKCFTGLGDLSQPKVDRDKILSPLVPPFTTGRLVELGRILNNSFAAAPALNKLFSVLMVDKPEDLDEILTVLLDGSLIPLPGDDTNVYKRKEKEAVRLGVADLDLLTLARTRQLAVFLEIGQWYLQRRMDTEQVLEGIYDRLASQGEDTKGYAEAIRAAYAEYRRHSAGAIEAARKRFDVAVSKLNALELADLDGEALDDGMLHASQWVGELRVTIDAVGKNAIASMESVFAAERAQRRATSSARYIDTQVRLARKMLAIMEIADKGYLLAVISSIEIMEAAMDRVLTGVVGVLQNSVATLQPTVAAYLEIVENMPRELEAGNRKQIVIIDQ